MADCSIEINLCANNYKIKSKTTSKRNPFKGPMNYDRYRPETVFARFSAEVTKIICFLARVNGKEACVAV